MAEIGVIGLGTMGANLALNFADHGFGVAVFNRTTSRTHDFMADAGDLAANLTPCESLAALAAALMRPRAVILMVPAGAAVDDQITALIPHLARGDAIIDAGNANFRDTQRRAADLAAQGFSFIGMGVSGGSEGARHGPSIMVGAEAADFARLAPMIDAIAAKFDGDPCAAHLGTDGAGHFVKTVHNGIEYADMQVIAEAYGCMRDGQGMAPGEIGMRFEAWNKGPLQSYLAEITGAILGARDPATGKPMVDVILDRAGQKGTGRWTLIEALELGQSATTNRGRGCRPGRGRRTTSCARSRPRPWALIPAALIWPARPLRMRCWRRGSSPWARALGCLRPRRGATTGVLIMRGSPRSGVPVALSARRFWMTSPAPFTPVLRKAICCWHRRLPRSLRRPCPICAGSSPPGSGPVCRFRRWRLRWAISTACAGARGTTDLIQAQRDFFGAHGFERLDGGSGHHGPWR